MEEGKSSESYVRHPAFLRLREKFEDKFLIEFGMIGELSCRARLGNLPKSEEPIMRESDAVGVGKVERFILLCEGILDEFSEPRKPEIDIWKYPSVTTP